MRLGLGLSMGGGGQGSSPPLGNLVIYGNSITAGSNASAQPNRYAEILKANAVAAGWTCTIVGQSGFSTNSQLGTVTTDVDALRVPGIKNVFYYMEGQNDIDQGATLTKLIEHTRSMIRGRQNVGFTCVTCTLPQRNGAAAAVDNPVITSYNSWLASNAATLGFTYADIAADAFMNDPNNTTYYDADGLHPIDAGHARLASIIQPLITTARGVSAVTPIASATSVLSGVRGGWSNAYSKVVGTWKDETAAGIDLTEATNPPATSTYNALPCWLFDGVNDQLGEAAFRLTPSGTVQATPSYTIHVVVELVSAGVAPMIHTFPPVTNELRCSGGTGVPSGVSNSVTVDGGGNIVGLKKYLAFSQIFIGGGLYRLNLWVDGVLVQTKSTGNGATTSLQQFLFGSRGSNYANMKLAEAALQNVEASAQEVHDFGTLMTAKWATPAVP